MSRAYRMMQQPDAATAFRRRYQDKSRVLRERDRTDESPILKAPTSILWHVAMTEPRREREASRYLTEAKWQVWYPQETIWRENAAKRERAKVNVPLFARYIFVTGQGAKPIADCRHVSCLLPYRVNARLISELDYRQRGGEFASADLPAFTEGQQVKADVGSFASLSGIVREVNHERVRILVNLFGSERIVEAAPDHVRAA